MKKDLCLLPKKRAVSVDISLIYSQRFFYNETKKKYCCRGPLVYLLQPLFHRYYRRVDIFCVNLCHHALVTWNKYLLSNKGLEDRKNGLNGLNFRISKL